MSDNLPPLPETTWMLWRHSTYEDPYCSYSEGYTEGDMLAYATAAVAAERERWADEIENRRVEIRQRAIDYLALDTEARALQDEVERLRAELEQRTAAVIVSESGQALACSASVSAAYGELRAERDALKADAASWKQQAEDREKDCVQFIAERDQARMQRERTVEILVEIHRLLYPPRFTAPDGRLMEFRPQGLDTYAVLQELSDRIRSIPDAIDAARKA